MFRFEDEPKPLRKKFCPFLICLFFTVCGYSQSFSVLGTVEDEEQQPVAYANILLMSAIDSTVIDGASSKENGDFAIGGIAKGDYLLKATYMDRSSATLTIQVTNDLKIPALVLQAASELEEVVVTGNKPRLERKVDRLVYNIENTALSDSEVWEVLKRTPAVTIVGDNLSVKGSSNVGILINGKKVHLPKSDIINLLSGTSASSVESIEVITAPPAKYSAEDSALINIIMKKNLVPGYNGTVYNRYVQGVLPKHTLGTEHYFKSKRTNLSLTYNFGHDRTVVKYNDITNFLDGGETTSIYDAEQINLRKGKRHNLSAFLDYDLGENKTLSLSAITIWQPKVMRYYDTDTNIELDSLYSRFDSYNISQTEQINTSYYVDYEQNLGDNGASLMLNGHYTFYDTSKGQSLNNSFYDLDNEYAGSNDFFLNTEQYINLYSFQADVSAPIGETIKVDVGARYADISSKNIVLQQGFDMETPGIDPTLAGTFGYDEFTWAGYTSVDAEWGDWHLKSGIRGEYTETRGTWNQGNENSSNDYLKFFPSFSARYTPNNDHDFNAYYVRRISRPRYSNINPFQIFQSNFSTIEGNPNLLPATDCYTAIGYTFKDTYTVELFYKNEFNGLGQFAFQDNQYRWLRFISFNMDREYAYGIDLIYNKEITKFWDSYFLASFYNQNLQFTNLNSNLLVENELFTWFARTSNNFTFLSDRSLTANLSVMYRAPLLLENARFDGFGYVNLNFRKTFWNNAASISIGLDDIFNQGNLYSVRNYLNQNGTSRQITENRLFTLGFRYRFGNVKIRSNKKDKDVDERDRL
ncbi:hypothetical protein D1013_00885 [Euzebyella marina]|uniref:Outer membrane protein beta-barrel domain-containing protein n=1 Tax=Euzebyella marina TaxID=1761453 RepID=A0A3G2L199_9FLAO|nr:hypothetical protein D1013_00885 [Euzebyella marina]